jgi:DNA polymerase III subunit gamma/tau
MGQALYRKYRSQNLDEIVGQEHITQALATAIKTGRISHAYLFTGPRGTGKTSIARILAYAINELPYSTDPHLDIIEIDAASNRRIDEIRDLRDKVYIAPTSAKYKVYIIDEVHMLTREAFNALLKTLEEPPEHVVFILATTDAHKLPETIISRTQRYTFRPVDIDKVAAHLAYIAKEEGIKAEPEALRLLAEHGEGSFRDSISMLDQVSNHDAKITVDAVRTQLGMPPDDAVNDLLATLTSGDISAPVKALQTLYDNGFRASTIAEQLAHQLRSQLTDGTPTLPSTAVLGLLKQLLNVAGAHNPERYLEVLLMEAAAPVDPVSQPAVSTPAPPAVRPAAVSKPAVAVPKAAAVKATPKSAAPKPLVETAAEAPIAKPVPKLTADQKPLNDETWPEVLAVLKKEYNTVYGIVRMAHTDFSEPGKVSLGFAFAFHQKRISDPKNRKIVTDAIEEVTGQRLELACSVSSGPVARPTTAAVSSTTPNTDPLKDISNVFGGGEVL